MATPVKDRIRTAIASTPALTAIIGTNPVRCYDRQLSQGSPLPAIVVQSISGGSDYALVGRFPTSIDRWQFTLWGVNNAAGIAALAALEAAMVDFFENLNLVGIPGLCSYSNQVVNVRDGFFPTPDPGNPVRIIDVFIQSNDSL